MLLTSTLESRNSELAKHANAGDLLIISRSQTGNGLVHRLQNVCWAIDDINPDFVFTSSSCALFASLKFQSLHPTHLHTRVCGLRDSYALRIVVCLVDDEDGNSSLPEVNRSAGLGDCALVCAWSLDEAARYIEFFHGCERFIGSSKESYNDDYMTQLHEALSCSHGVHRIDAATLATRFGTFACILRATHKSLLSSPGLGVTKVLRLSETFHTPLQLTSHF